MALPGADSLSQSNGDCVFLPLPIDSGEGLGQVCRGDRRLQVQHILADMLQAIDTWPAESLDAAIVPTGGDLQTILITYANWPTEAMNAAMTVTAAEIVT